MGRQATLVVVGGGAAGFFCAVNAARMAPGLQVVILEKSDKLLSKVRISGGGRCNVTHACADRDEMATHYPRGKHFVRKAFHRFFTDGTIQWFAQRGVALKTEPDGRMFPVTDDSATIVECLLREASAYGVDIRLRSDVKQVVVTNPETGGRFNIVLASGQQLRADYLSIATGGFPKRESFQWIEAFGHSIETPVPSLFTLNAPDHPLTALMGIAVQDAIVRIRGTKLSERGPVLITHWGLSGPAVLRVSARGARELSDKQYTGDAVIQWLPEYSTESLRQALADLREQRGTQQVLGRNPFDLPQRLWAFLAETAGVSTTARWCDVSNKTMNRLAEMICLYPLPFRGKTVFKDEFVTAGGVRTAEVDPHSMQSRIVPGLFFAGEILDVDGLTGGYNFQHAWTGGYNAAMAIARDATGIPGAGPVF